jgi:hypothetical protein
VSLIQYEKETEKADGFADLSTAEHISFQKLPSLFYHRNNRNFLQTRWLSFMEWHWGHSTMPAQ